MCPPDFDVVGPSRRRDLDDCWDTDRATLLRAASAGAPLAAEASCSATAGGAFSACMCDLFCADAGVNLSGQVRSSTRRWREEGGSSWGVGVGMRWRNAQVSSTCRSRKSAIGLKKELGSLLLLSLNTSPSSPFPRTHVRHHERPLRRAPQLHRAGASLSHCIPAYQRTAPLRGRGGFSSTPQAPPPQRGSGGRLPRAARFAKRSPPRCVRRSSRPMPRAARRQFSHDPSLRLGLSSAMPCHARHLPFLF